jgi:hypothetical protein
MTNFSSFSCWLARPLAALSLLLATSGATQAQVSTLDEHFDTAPPAAWSVQNRSNPVGNTSWFLGNAAFGPQATTGYIAAQFSSTAGAGTISNWLLTPQLNLTNGATLTFWTRNTNAGYADRLQVRLSTSGGSTSVGTTETSTGDFGTLLLDLNPTLAPYGYPGVWRQYTITVSGLAAPTAGRVAFRYFVANGGPSGANSDYIGLDEVSYQAVAAPTLTALNPARGPVGTRVTLSGTALTDATGVRFNGTAAATFAVVDAATLTATVPPGATSGPVTVTTSGGTSNGLAFVVGPAANNTLAFDGTNDFVIGPTGSPVPVGNSPYTIEAWIKPTAMGYGGIVGWGDYGLPSQVNAFRIGPELGGALVNFWWGDDLTVAVGDISGQWHHVAATFDGTTRSIYLDGVLRGSDTPTGHNVPNAANLRIGSTTPPPTGSGELFSGSLDDLRIYDAGLTQAQVQADMFGSAPALPAHLMASYDFNQGIAGGNNALVDRILELPGNRTGPLSGFALNGPTSNWVRSFPTLTGISPASGPPGTSVSVTGTNLTDVTGFRFSTAAVAPFAPPTDDYGATVAVPTGATTGPVSLASVSLAAYPGSVFTVLGSPLPVQLVAFTAEAQGPDALLRWHTASELHNARFEVEASPDGTHFERRGTVAGAGSSSSTARHYSFLDADLARYAALPGTPLLVYYRLHQVDLDSTASYSLVRSVVVAHSLSYSVRLFPNPAAGGATTLTGTTPGAAVQVLDSLGCPVATVTADASGTALLPLPAGLAAGVYVVRSGTQVQRLMVK